MYKMQSSKVLASDWVPPKVKKMKSYLVSALFAAYLSLAVGAAIENANDSSEEITEYKFGAVKKYLNDSGYVDRLNGPLEDWCAGSSDKFWSALEAVVNCDNAIPDSVTTCDTVRQYGLKCTRPLIKLVSECIPEASKDLPELAVKSMISAFDYICKQNGEHIFELGSTCFFGVESQDPKVQVCRDKLQLKVKGWSTGEMPTKKQVCNFGDDARACLQLHIPKVCTNEKTRNANLGLADAILAPCNA